MTKNGTNGQTGLSRVFKSGEYNRFEKIMVASALIIYFVGILAGMVVAFGPRTIWDIDSACIWIQIVIGVIVCIMCAFGSIYILIRTSAYNRSRRGLCNWSNSDMDELEKRVTELERAVKGNEKD